MSMNQVELHHKITELLLDAFMPAEVMVDKEGPTYRLVRRAVSSITGDIVRLAEDCYGISKD